MISGRLEWFKYEIGTEDKSDVFGDLIDECNLQEIIKDEMIGKAISEAIMKDKGRFPQITYEQWQHIAILALDKLLQRHSQMEFKGYGENLGRRKQFINFLGKFLHLRMLDYVSKYKGVDLVGNPTCPIRENDSLPEDNPENTFFENVDYDLLVEKIKLILTEKEWDVFNLHLLEGYSQEEVGRKISITQQRVSQLNLNLLKKIKEIV